jgi:hypothetical protein
MNRIVETLQESQSLIESWGDVIDVTEFMTDTPGFFQANSLGVYTQIYDRADGRYRPVYTNESDLKIIRAMSWLLVERVPMAQAWINRLLDYTIGTGFDWTIKAEDKRLEKAIQAYVRETLDNSKWSSELERESYAREVGEGEVIIEHVYENGQCLAIACEADELTEPASKGELEDWIGVDFVPSWTFGVLTRESRPQNPIGYHFCRNQTGSDWDYVTADKVSHWKRNVRARAKRGFSDFYKPHLYLLRADRVLTNTAEGAATQAAIAYIVEHRDGQQRQAENIVKRFSAPTGRVDPMTGIMERKRKMKPGTRLDVPEGQTYKAGLLGANNSGIYIEVMEAALRLAGSVHAFVEGMLTGSYSNNNFASALVAEGPFMQGRLAEQSQRKERMREMILKMIRLGAGKRRFAAVGYESWDSIRDAITVEVIPSRIVPMDPLKTSQALEVQKRNGWVSDKTCINELGRDIDTETANGLKVGGAENQPGSGGQPGAQTNENTGAAVPDLGNVSKTEQEQGGEWLGITTLQWRRNRKAITDVLTDFARGKLKRNVAKVLLRSIGIPDRGIETILDDASDGQIDSMPQMESLTEAERKTLNKPFRTSGGPKKFSVYVKNQKGNVVKVNFGDPKMRIKRDDPGSRRGFRARHNCQDPGPKWKARYWSCRMWSKPSVTKILKESLETGEIGWDGRTFVRESWLYKQNPRLLEVRDGDGDGKINDGKPSEAPAEKKDKKKRSTAKTEAAKSKDFNGIKIEGELQIGPISQELIDSQAETITQSDLMYKDLGYNRKVSFKKNGRLTSSSMRLIDSAGDDFFVDKNNQFFEIDRQKSTPEKIFAVPVDETSYERMMSGVRANALELSRSVLEKKTRFDKPSLDFAQNLKSLGLDPRLVVPSDSNSRYVYVKLPGEENEYKIRFADHAQPVQVGSKGKEYVGGFDKEKGVRHSASDISIDPQTGLNAEDAIKSIKSKIETQKSINESLTEPETPPTEVQKSNELSGRQKAILEGWKDYP